MSARTAPLGISSLDAMDPSSPTACPARACPQGAAGEQALLTAKVEELRRQLDGIGACAEQTAGAVLGSVEAMMRLVERAGPALDGPAQDHLLTILGACGFQDIIGQRLTAARDAIGSIERRLDSLAGGTDIGPAAREAEASGQQRRHELLLNGPQAPAEALSQDDIDALFA